MRDLYRDFDFAILNDPGFKEDSVREELVAPLLWALGFAASGKFKIQRSTPLQHPYVSIGSIRRQIHIYPDYLLSVSNRIVCTIDAKAPSESVDDPDHLSQAYTYAVHRDVRSEFYGLCNGHEIAVYRVSKMSAEPYYRASLADVPQHEEEVVRHLSPLALHDAIDGKFAKDFGLHLKRLGVPGDMDVLLPFVGVFRVGRVADELYTIMANCTSEEEEYAASFDFGAGLVPELLSQLPSDTAMKLGNALRKDWPSLISISSPGGMLAVNILARVGSELIENDDEIYCPLVVREFPR